MRTVLLWVHAAAGVVALVLGWRAAVKPPVETPTLMTWVVWSVGVMVGALVGAVALDWPRLTTPSRATFLGLSVLAAYALWRAIHAHRAIRHTTSGWHERYLADLGFVLITLFDGFAIVTAIDLHAPVWLVVAIAIVVVWMGRLLLDAAAKRPVPSS